MKDSASIFIWSLILVGSIVVVFLAVAFIRRQFFRVESYPKQGFTIAELRKLRDSGQISATEYDKAKMLLLNEQGQATKPNDKNQP